MKFLILKRRIRRITAVLVFVFTLTGLSAPALAVLQFYNPLNSNGTYPRDTCLGTSGVLNPAYAISSGGHVSSYRCLAFTGDFLSQVTSYDQYPNSAACRNNGHFGAFGQWCPNSRPLLSTGTLPTGITTEPSAIHNGVDCGMYGYTWTDGSHCECPSNTTLTNGSCIAASTGGTGGGDTGGTGGGDTGGTTGGDTSTGDNTTTNTDPNGPSDPIKPVNIADIQEARNDCDSENLSESNCQIVKYLNNIFNVLSGLVALAVIGNIIFAGIKYSMAQGNASESSAAKKRITGAVIALIMFIMLSSFIQWLIPGGIF